MPFWLNCRPKEGDGGGWTSVPGIFGLLKGGGVDSRVYGWWGKNKVRKVLCCVCVLCGFDLELRKIL